MQNLLLQSKDLFQKNRVLFFSVLFLLFLPFFGGKILFSLQAYLLGKYINYLHVRITLHLLLGLLVVWQFGISSKWQSFKYIAAAWVLLAFISIFPIFNLTSAIGISFFPLYLSSIFHLFEFIVGAIALGIACITVLKATRNEHIYAWFALTISIIMQLAIGIGQFLLKGPLFPNLLSWTGQPLQFTSESIIGIFGFFRVYGTTPHPNILGGILVLSIFLVLSFNVTRLQKLITIGLATLLLIGTLSKSAMFALLVLLIIYLLRSKLTAVKLNPTMGMAIFFFCNVVLITGLALAHTLGVTENFIMARANVQTLYFELITHYPRLLLTGTGFTMSIPNLLANATELPTSIIWGNQVIAETPTPS